MDRPSYRPERVSRAYETLASGLRRPGRRYDPPEYKTRNLTLAEASSSSLSLPRNNSLDPEAVDYRMLNGIEKEINDALYTFQTERSKQNDVLQKMRSELRHINTTQQDSAGKPDPYSTSDLREKNSVLKEKLSHCKSKNKLLKEKLKSESKEKLSFEELNRITEKYEAEIRSLKLQLGQQRSKFPAAADQSAIEKELANVRIELRNCKNELNDQLLANKVMKQDLDLLRTEKLSEISKPIMKIDAVKRNLANLLKQGAAEYDYLKNLDYTKETAESLSEETCTLVDYLLKEKKGSDLKYAKLLELHNKLIQVNSKENEKYNAEYIYGLADENEKLKAELRKTLSLQTELGTENERLKAKLELAEKEIGKKANWEVNEVQMRVAELEGKIKDLESRHGSDKKAKTSRGKTSKLAPSTKSQHRKTTKGIQ